MTTTDTSERGLESLIVAALTGVRFDPHGKALNETPAAYGGLGYALGNPADYDRGHCVDTAQLRAFLDATQPAVVTQLNLDDPVSANRFLHRVFGEVAKRGVVDVLRNGVKHGPAAVELFYGAASPGNPKAAAQYAANRFSVTRQLRYSQDEMQLALDLCLFVNGLPLATFELKNRLTKQTVHDAIRQYQEDRDPREALFAFGRCLVHFAVDDQEVRMCTELKGKASWFLPFNQGWNDGAGNPPNPAGLKTAYLWERILAKPSLTDIVENFAQKITDPDAKGGKKRERLIFPRYHQLDVVRRLLADVTMLGAGRRYLIQHSAGSGKSNSIAWLAHQLVNVTGPAGPVFDSIVVVTDRVILDRQIRDTIKDFTQVSAIMGHADRSGDLRAFLQQGKKIIITTVQKFPFVLDEIEGELASRRFALIIDEAHSSQGGRTTAAMHRVLGATDGDQTDGDTDAEEDVEDKINRLIESRRMLTNASYFAFTATPKNKTLELFGERFTVGAEVKRRAFHTYSMKQAIQEGFILDVLAHYTTVSSYYHLAKTVADDPQFDKKKALSKLKRYVESHDHAIRRKAEIMVDDFHERVLAAKKIGGEARAMVVTGGISLAISYYHAITAYLVEIDSPYQAIVAFSGEHEDGGGNPLGAVTEAKLNGFASNLIPAKFREDPYRFLVVADKFQTGYDEPLLHTMYVDKPLSGIKAVQTLSRLNRSHPKKHDTFVLDFANDEDTIRAAFEPYYRGTVLAAETDPNKLHDLQGELDAAQVYAPAQVDDLVARFLAGAGREQLDPILDVCAGVYIHDLNEEEQVTFKGSAKAFVRTYNFLAAILPYGNMEWEKRAIFLNLLLPKLPAPVEDDLSRHILEAVDMDSYRAEVQATVAIRLADDAGEIDPIPVGEAGHRPETELEALSNILALFHERFGNIQWKDADHIGRLIAEEIPAQVAANAKYQNAMRNSDRENARVEHDRALHDVLLALFLRQTDQFTDASQLFKQFADNPQFHRELADLIFRLTYRPPAADAA